MDLTHTSLITIDSLSLLMAGLIIIVAAIVTSFSRRYMDGNKNYRSFFINLGLLTLSVLTLVLSNHILIFISAWLVMGLLLANMIGHSRDWDQARKSKTIARLYFVFGSGALALALGILGWQTGQWNISGLLMHINAVDTLYLWVSGALIVTAAMVQSALFPFHKWLLASMTAPTPVSAFMHAGLVNAGGFLIVRFVPLFSALPEMLLFIFAIGALTAFLGSFWMLTQSDIKRGLGCSTVAQMGFMVMQCGLGFYTAAIAHLILHGFYKAYHFLAAGSSIAKPQLPLAKINAPIITAPLVLCCGIIAAVIFATMTGKSLTNFDSGLILTAFAALAGMQAAYGLAHMTHMNILARSIISVTLVSLATALYAILFISISAVLPVNDPQPITWLHAAVLGGFTISWLLMIFGVHQKSDKAYMKSLNAAQPPLKTILNHRSSYNA